MCTRGQVRGNAEARGGRGGYTIRQQMYGLAPTCGLWPNLSFILFLFDSGLLPETGAFVFSVHVEGVKGLARCLKQVAGNIFLIALIVMISGIAQAAEIKRIDDRVCTILFKGEIVYGDAQRLWNLAPDHTDILCLDSQGGSFSEAISIAERLDGGWIGTRLEEGAECLSACALIFVAASQFEEIHVPIRSKHQKARLGFHAPYALPPRGQYTEQSIAEAFRVGTEAVALMMRLGTVEGRFGYQGVFPNDMLIQILEKGPGEFYEIDRPERAKALGIKVFGFQAPEWTQAQVCTACDHWFEMSRYPNACERVQTRVLSGGVIEYRVQGYEAEAMAQCVVRVDANKGLAAIRTYGLWPGDYVQNSPFQKLDDWYAYAKTGSGN